MEVRAVQRDVLSLIKLAVSEHPIDLAKFVTRTLENILPEVKDQLEIDFDTVRVYPGPQPRESADIELYKDGSLIAKLNAKTCMSGDLRATVNKLKLSVRSGEDGLIIAFVTFEKEDKADLKMVIIYIPRIVIVEASPSEIVDYIMDLLWRKTASEGYISFYLIAFNEAVNLVRAYQAIMAVEIAKEAMKEAKEAKEGIRRLEKRIDRLEERMDKLEERMDRLEGRMDRLEKKMEKEFKEIKEMIKKLYTKD